MLSGWLSTAATSRAEGRPPGSGSMHCAMRSATAAGHSSGTLPRAPPRRQGLPLPCPAALALTAPDPP